MAYSDGTSIFSVPADGGAPPARLGAGQQPQWSPDGRRIAWTGKGGVWVASASGRGAELVIKHAAQPTWSPNATRLAYLAENGDLWSARPDGTAARRLLNVRSPAFANVSLDGAPTIAELAWSPTGTTIGILAQGGAGVSGAQAFLLSVDAGGKHGWRRLQYAANIEGPMITGPSLAYAPDGRTVALGAVTLGQSTEQGFVTHPQVGPNYTALVDVAAGPKTITYLGPPIPAIINAGYSPDGRSLCGLTLQGLAVLDLASGAITSVAVPALATTTLTLPSVVPPATFTCSWRRAV